MKDKKNIERKERHGQKKEEKKKENLKGKSRNVGKQKKIKA